MSEQTGACLGKPTEAKGMQAQKLVAATSGLG